MCLTIASSFPVRPESVRASKIASESRAQRSGRGEARAPAASDAARRGGGGAANDQEMTPPVDLHTHAREPLASASLSSRLFAPSATGFCVDALCSYASSLPACTLGTKLVIMLVSYQLSSVNLFHVYFICCFVHFYD